MSFSKYMTSYKNQLTNLNSLEAIIKEAPKNHRLQKLLVGYMLKDRRILNRVLGLSKHDPYAEKLVCHAKIALMDLCNSESVEKRRLASQLLKNTRLKIQNVPEENIKYWERVGYAKIFETYLAEQKKNNMSHQMKVRVDKKLREVNWDKLITS